MGICICEIDMVYRNTKHTFKIRLKNYLKSDLNIVQFFINFERVLTDTRYQEWEAEYDLQFRIAHVKFDIKMLKQAREVYTKAIFKLFQDQFEESIGLSITNCVADGDAFVYTVELDDKSKKRKVKREGTTYIKIIKCSYTSKNMLRARALASGAWSAFSVSSCLVSLNDQGVVQAPSPLPRAPSVTPDADPIALEGKCFTKRLVLHRDVLVFLEGLDNSGHLVGSIYYTKKSKEELFLLRNKS
ncbi:hypothetical protein ACFX13_015771 [Malus domestica]